MEVDHINAQGGIKSLGSAKLKLVVLDSSDTTEKAKNAAQRMVAQDLLAANGLQLVVDETLTPPLTEVTPRCSASARRSRTCCFSCRRSSANGNTRQEIREVFMQAAIYCGIPAGVDAFRNAREVFAGLDQQK